jgi:hypothetical protein
MIQAINLRIYRKNQNTKIKFIDWLVCFVIQAIGNILVFYIDIFGKNKKAKKSGSPAWTKSL